MSTVAEIEQQLAALRTRLGSLEAAKDAANQEIRRLGEEKAQLRAASQRQLAGGDTAGASALRSQEARLDEVIGEAYSGPAFKNLEAAQSEIRSLENQLYKAQQKAAFDAQQQKQPPAAEERTAEQKAESDRTTPVVDKPAPVPPEGGGTAKPAPTAEKPVQTQQPIPKDDNLAKSKVNTEQQANVAGNLKTDTTITARPNVLDNFASTAWAASVYLLSPSEYKDLILSRKKRVNGYNLLFQSGGAPNNVGGFQGALATGQQSRTTATGGNETVAPGIPGAAQADAGRNPAFDLDFYIDSLTIENAIQGKETQAAHSVTTLKFNVIEPGNISLLDRLYKAVQDMAQRENITSAVNYASVQYLLVVRWYGYDINGNLIAGGTAPGPDGKSDVNAIVEKFIPFVIRKINWSVNTKLTNYEFDCAAANDSIPGSTRRGSVPYDVQLAAGTVGQLLNGGLEFPDTAKSAGSTTVSGGGGISQGRTNSQKQREADAELQRESRRASAPPPASAAQKVTLKRGLAAAMNDYSEDLMVSKTYELKDTYNIVFAAGAEAIKNASLVIPQDIVVQQSTPMTNSTDPNQTLNPATNQVNTTARSWSITAGMQVVQAIDIAIRNSTYITDQALTLIDSEGNEKQNPQSPKKNIRWFNISMQAIPSGYDSARNDFAYDITYIISPYTMQNFDSKYFPIGAFRGVHKSYPYWFTGLNTAVLDFQANFNPSYNMTISGGPGVNSNEEETRRKLTSVMRDQVIYTYFPNSVESGQNAAGRTNEIGANAAEYIYAYADPGGTKLRIIGDPAWIQQGSVGGGVSIEEFSYSSFLPDGTINYDAEQVMFEIAWQRPEDYNLATGLADPYARPGNQSRQPRQSNVYLATKVTNEFRGGKFEQVITGALYPFPIPDGSNTATGGAAVNDALAASWKNNGSTDSANKGPQETQREAANELKREGRGISAPQGSAGAGQGFAALDPRRLDLPAVNDAVNAFSTASGKVNNFFQSAQTALNGSGAISPNFVALIQQNATQLGQSSALPNPGTNALPSGFPRAPTGSGVNPITFGNAPLPLNTNPYSQAGRTQIIAKD